VELVNRQLTQRFLTGGVGTHDLSQPPRQALNDPLIGVDR
jgi:hypothetical protein